MPAASLLTHESACLKRVCTVCGELDCVVRDPFDFPDEIARYHRHGGRLDAVREHSGETLLHAAARAGDLDMVVYLMDRQQDLAVRRNCLLDTPYDVAFKRGFAEVAQLLVVGRAKPAAVQVGNCEICGAQVPERHRELHRARCSRLHYACEWCGRMVPERDREVHQALKDQLVPALRENDLDAAEEAVRHGADAPRTLLHDTVAWGDPETVGWVAAAFPELAEVELPMRGTALETALRQGKVACALALV